MEYSKFPGGSHTVLGDRFNSRRSKSTEKKIGIWLSESPGQQNQQMFTLVSLTLVCGRIQKRNGLKMTQYEKTASKEIISLASICEKDNNSV